MKTNLTVKKSAPALEPLASGELREVEGGALSLPAAQLPRSRDAAALTGGTFAPGHGTETAIIAILIGL
jgi:hypothetical protein